MAPRGALTQSIEARQKDMDVTLNKEILKAIRNLNSGLLGGL